MDAIIGKYRLRMEDARLILTHSAGISFDLTHDEALGLWHFINVYRQSIERERDTEGHLPSIIFHEEAQPVESM